METMKNFIIFQEFKEGLEKMYVHITKVLDQCSGMLLKIKSLTDTLKCFYSIAKSENAVENSFLHNHISANSITPVSTPEFTLLLC